MSGLQNRLIQKKSKKFVQKPAFPRINSVSPALANIADVYRIRKTDSSAAVKAPADAQPNADTSYPNLMTLLPKTTRRTFIKAAGISTTLLSVTPNVLRAMSPRPIRKGKLIAADKKMKIACIGCGGKGFSDITSVGTEDVVALCDVDFSQAEKICAKYPDVPKFKDFREMLQKMDSEIDGVTISTPDHVHYVAGKLAIGMGKHVFIQKPLTHSIWEARDLLAAARRHGVITQMGNQGHAGEGIRLVREWVQADLIGPVREVHVWTSKTELGRYKSTLKARPQPGEQPPPSLDWNLWVGPAPMRPYSEEYHPRRWRNWWDFGCGALGDIGCHTMDAAFYALDLGAPAYVQAETAPYNEETYPDWSIITYEFAQRGAMPPVRLVWYDGGKTPPRPPGLEPNRTFDLRYGYYMVGDKGVIYDQSEKCSSPRLVPETRMRETLFPERSIPRVPGGDPLKEWIAGCKGGPLPGSNFEYAVPLTEMVLLGNIAIRARGKRIRWQAAGMKIPNARELEEYLGTERRTS